MTDKIISRVASSDELEDITYHSADDYVELNDSSQVAIMENEQFDTRRWYSIHRVVWCENHEGENHYFSYLYEQPLTELQEVDEEYDVTSIRPVQRKVEVKEVVTYA